MVIYGTPGQDGVCIGFPILPFFQTYNYENMRYALRNKHKITAAYDLKYYNRIIESLDKHFAENEEIELIQIEGDDYESIMVNDVGHTVNMFVFYMIRKTFDVYNLAFKEGIG